MILAEKIMQLRKKSGWSQEELADKMNVSRQSVSKWESAQSVPDLDKILQLSKIFSVSTDYLLREEMEEAEYTCNMESEPAGEAIRKVSMEEANAFLQVKEYTAKKIATATLLCILAPICLILFSIISESSSILHITEEQAAAIGLIVLFLLVAVAVAIFISCGMKTESFNYLDHEVIETEYGVTGMVKERKKEYHDTYARYNIIGACLCILGVIPLCAGAIISGDSVVIGLLLALMFVTVGIGVWLFIVAGIRQASMQKLLQEGDYTKEKKKRNPVAEAVSGAYWLIVTALFLLVSFRTGDWGDTWLIWVIAGLLYAVIMIILGAFQNTKKNF